jgi:hypothetical protein
MKNLYVAIEIAPPQEHEGIPQAEKAMQDSARGIRSLLTHASLPIKFWGLASEYYHLTRNFLPSKSNHDNGKPPIMTWLNLKELPVLRS